MRLKQARVRKYRSIRDTGYFDVEDSKTILVGPNEAGKTALLQALQRINPPEGVPGFNPLRDYPRSELNDLDSGRVLPSAVTVVEARFALDPDDKAAVQAIDPRFVDCEYSYGVRLDNTRWHQLENAPQPLAYATIKDDLIRLRGHVDGRWTAPTPAAEGQAPDLSSKPSTQLSATIRGLTDATVLTPQHGEALKQWLEGVLHLVEEANAEETARHKRLLAEAQTIGKHALVQTALESRRPVFVYFSDYFRVRPLIHLSHLAARLEQGLLDDDQYDFGNHCLLKLLGFTARELSDLGQVAEPPPEDPAAVQAYRDQLDRRTYRLNAAEVRLTEDITEVWDPDDSYGDSFRIRIRADQQYLKVVVEDGLGVEIELDQRSQGMQWLISFFVVFFAEAADKYNNSILLLDEPGLHLHGLKQRKFRETLSNLAQENQVLYTTHSPFLVGPDELDLVRVVEMADRPTGTKVHTSITASDPAALLPLQEALGYDMAQSLFMQQRNLVLEGLTDYWYLEATSALLRDSGSADLLEDIALIPAQSAGKVVYFATILHAQSLKVAALLDSDTAGDQAAHQDTLVHTLGNKNILRTKDVYKGPVQRPEIEDLLRATLLRVAVDDLGWADATTQAAAQSDRPVTEVMADVVGSDFSKYRLAKAFLRWSRSHSSPDLATEEQANWISLIGAVNKALG